MTGRSERWSISDWHSHWLPRALAVSRITGYRASAFPISDLAPLIAMFITHLLAKAVSLISRIAFQLIVCEQSLLPLLWRHFCGSPRWDEASRWVLLCQNSTTCYKRLRQGHCFQMTTNLISNSSFVSCARWGKWRENLWLSLRATSNNNNNKKTSPCLTLWLCKRSLDGLFFRCKLDVDPEIYKINLKTRG